MLTFLFFFKKIALAFVVIVSVGFAYSAIAYANSFTTAQTVALDKELYYLVDESTHTQAVSSFAQLQGGAGYVLETDAREYVAYSMYFDKTESESAQTSLQEQDVKTTVHVVSVDALIFRTREQKRRAPAVISAFSCLDGCMQVLNQEIARLEKGATQQSSKRILTTLIDQFTHLQTQHQTSYPEFALVCENAKKQLQNCISDIVYVKDLRYVLCELGVAYAGLSQEFTL